MRWRNGGTFVGLVIGALVGGAALLGCGTVVPHGGVPVETPSAAAQLQLPLQANDLIPADLDLVMRIDLTRIRSNLGAEASDELMRQALEKNGPEGIAREALAGAEVIWLGLRLADLETGDRVMVVHGPKQVKPDDIGWERSQPEAKNEPAPLQDEDAPKLWRFDRRTPPPRAGTASIFTLGDSDSVFVSPVQRDSVARLLVRGPDPQRGQPEARGLISIDYRAQRFSPELEDRFPSLAALIGGVDRLTATVALAGSGLELEGRIRCKSSAAATRVMRFLKTIRDVAGRRPRYRDVMAVLELSQTEASVQIRWPLPREVVVATLVKPPPEADDAE